MDFVLHFHRLMNLKTLLSTKMIIGNPEEDLEYKIHQGEPEKQFLTETIIRFIHSIGIKTVYGTTDHETFLPGILIHEGSLIIDRKKLLYPGDLLHEAGHIAVMKKEDRMHMTGNVGLNKNQSEAGGEELMAIAWSYAAVVHLRLNPEVVFHANGYMGASQWYIDQYTSGTYIALPALQWIGLCYDEKQAALHNAKPYPYMNKWLRD